jgi:hypothetical protein
VHPEPVEADDEYVVAADEVLEDEMELEAAAELEDAATSVAASSTILMPVESPPRLEEENDILAGPVEEAR